MASVEAQVMRVLGCAEKGGHQLYVPANWPACMSPEQATSKGGKTAAGWKHAMGAPIRHVRRALL